MHQFDQFKQDMEKMSKAKLTNPIKSDKNKPERSTFDLTELNRNDLKLTNLYQFEDVQTHPHCTVLTLDGINGFSWYDEFGNRHDEGLTWPKMTIHRDATVEILFGPNGERSAGWHNGDPSDLP